MHGFSINLQINQLNKGDNMFIKIPIKKKMDSFIVLKNYVGQRHYAINRVLVSNITECNLKGNILNGNNIIIDSIDVEKMESILNDYIVKAKRAAIPQRKLCFVMDNNVMAMPFICDGKVILVNIDLIKMIEEKLINVTYFADGLSNQQLIAKVDGNIVGVLCAVKYSQDRLLNAVQDLAKTETCRIFENIPA